MSTQPLSDTQRDTIRARLLAYADTDLLCYWAEEAELQAQQRAQWEPVIQAVEGHFGVYLNRVVGIMPAVQPDATIVRLKTHIDRYDDAGLLKVMQLAELVGSLLLVLAYEIQAVSAQDLPRLAHLDEDYQAARWGLDAQAKAQREQQSADIIALTRQIDGILDEC